MKSKSHAHRVSRLGAWLPRDQRHLAHWLRTTRTAIRKHGEKFHPVVRDFLELIEGDPVLRMYFTRMFQEQPHRRMQAVWGVIRIRNYVEMLEVLNHVLTRAPEYNRTYMVGCPINALLDYPMITPAGLAAFADERVNAMLRRYSGQKSRHRLALGYVMVERVRHDPRGDRDDARRFIQVAWVCSGAWTATLGSSQRAPRVAPLLRNLRFTSGALRRAAE
jgi:hypothetical protein